MNPLSRSILGTLLTCISMKMDIYCNCKACSRSSITFPASFKKNTPDMCIKTENVQMYSWEGKKIVSHRMGWIEICKTSNGISRLHLRFGWKWTTQSCSETKSPLRSILKFSIVAPQLKQFGTNLLDVELDLRFSEVNIIGYTFLGNPCL